MSGAESKRSRVVVWAVDPFEEGSHPLASSVRELAHWAERSGLELLPTHIVAQPEKAAEAGRVPLVPEIERAVSRYLKRYHLGKEPRTAVIVSETGTRASAVQAVLDLAEKERAEWIVVSSHGRTGITRLVSGSFAELLLRESPIPVLFLPRYAVPRAAAKRKTALFPTDFSAAAQEALDAFLPSAEAQRYEVLVFHALTVPVPSADLSLGGGILPANFPDDQEAWARRRGAETVRRIQSRGVRARFMLEKGIMVALVGRAVLDTARREGVRLIAMPSLSGPFTRLVAGSVAQDVVRAGLYPVWVYGPRALSGVRGRAA
ncbi:MAG TPA: universal stress protein [Bdellovibrionota bacterium]|jgi:nucleotide-binding universal stress UspA family protein